MAAAQPHEQVLIGTVEDIDLPTPSPVLVADATRKEEVPKSALPSKPDKSHRVGLVLFAGRPIFAGALCVTIAMLAWHHRPTRLIFSAQNAGNAVRPPVKANVAQSDAKQVIEPRFGTDRETIPATTASNPEPSSPHPRLLATELRENLTSKVIHAVKKRNDAANPPVAHKTREEALRIQVPGAPLRLLYPTYPETSVHGKVSLKAVISYDGKVKEVKVLNGNQVLAEAATRAVRQWRYVPYRKEGQAFESEANIIVSFIARDVITISFPLGTPVSR